ncbi:MAG: hypothetical protein Q9N67_10515 [Ghiorsea sp.]|nr:hypothetical protein [Ghiorsea sp.]
MKLVRPLMIASTLLIAGQVNAASLDINPTGFAQSQFDGLSKDLGAATWMTPSNSAEPHSAGFIPIGVQIAIEGTGVSIDPNASHWAALPGVSGLNSVLPVPRLRVSAGIPFGLDVGYMVSQIPSSNISMTGFEGRMAFGNYIPIPMLEANIRIHSSSLTGIPDMEITSQGFAAMIGANLPFVKPYVEFGQTTITSTPSGLLASAGVTEYSKDETTMVVGVKVQLAVFILNAEQATVGDKDITSIKLGFEF